MNEHVHAQATSAGSACERTVVQLKDRGAEVQDRGGYCLAQCPAHEDRRPSLSISQGDRGATLKCHSGCTVEEVMAALGVTWIDLFDRTEKEPA